jgi:protein TonB
MNILENNVAKLNDIIFENRNKSYGAYAIRSMYDNTILKSLAITASLFASVSVLAMLLSNTAPEEVKLGMESNIIPETIISCDFHVEPVVTPEIAPKPSAGSQSRTVAVSTNFNDHAIEPETDPVQSIESTSHTAGTATDPESTTGTGSGTSSDPDAGTSNGLGDVNHVENLAMLDVQPSFDLAPFLKKHLVYPALAREAGISGKVVVTFTIDAEGNVAKAVLYKGLGGGCDEEVMRVIKLMPKWTPGIFHGKPVSVSFNQVIDFRLQ